MIRYIIYLFICFVFCIVFNTTFIKLKHIYKKTHEKTNLKKVEPIEPKKPIQSFKPIEPKKPIQSFKPKQKIDIIIPFRDRHAHFKKIKSHFDQLKYDILIYVIEQNNNKHFNRAWLMNIGIKESMKHRQADCIVTSDVDIFGDVDYSWCDKPTQICSELDCHGNGVPYYTSAGGVIQAKPADWVKINGFTNKAEGWGGEDDDLHHRFKQNNLLTKGALRRPPKGKGICKCLHDDDHTKRVRSNKYHKIVSQIDRLSRGSKEWKKDGLNNLKYYFNKTVDKNVFWYKVDTLDKELDCCLPQNKRCTWWNDPKKTIPDCEKKNLISILHYIHSLDVEYFMMYGTLLGALREKDHIEHDTDIDIAMNRIHFEQFKKKIKNGPYYFENTIPARVFFSRENTIHVDIWLYEFGRKNIQLERKSKYIYIETKNIFPLKKCNFGINQYFCPQRSEIILQKLYGNWRISKSRTKDHFKDGDGLKYKIQDKIIPVCEKKTSGKMWNVFSDAVNILNDLEAPWILYSGSLLFYYRDCKVPHDDLDIQLDLDWMVKNNKKLSNYFLEKKFKKKTSFGTIGKMGYEETWVKDDIKIDIFSYVQNHNRLTSGLTVNKTIYPCSYTMNFIEIHSWNGINLNIPGPVEDVLHKTYNNWRIPVKYIWNISPFEDGFCIKNM